MLNSILNRLNKILIKSPWHDYIDDKIIINTALKIFEEDKKDYSKSKIIYRLCGQSGAGKTSQLLPAIKKGLLLNNKKAKVIAVRNFAKYHPNYKELLKLYSKNQIREKTNSFALKCLFLTLYLYLKNGYEIIYDVTLLSIEYEKLLCDVLKFFNYTQIFNIIAVNKKISDKNILKRQNDTHNLEFGRIINKNSVKYFYENLNKSIKYLSKNEKATAIIWTSFYLYPVYYGNIKNCYNKFKKLRKIKRKNIYTEKELLNNKIKIYNNLIKKFW